MKFDKNFFSLYFCNITLYNNSIVCLFISSVKNPIEIVRFLGEKKYLINTYIKEYIMHYIEIHLKSNRVVFSSMDRDAITHYIFSFFTSEQKAQFEQDLQYCFENAYLHPLNDESFYSNLGKNVYHIDPATNTLKITFIAHQINHICENLFDPPKVGVTPVKEYFDNNPSEGDYDLFVYDSNGNDVTSTYSKI